MEPVIIRAEDLEEQAFLDTRVTAILNTNILSIAKIRKVGDDIKTGYDTESDVIYYVLAGEGECEADGKTYRLKQGDCVLYTKGTPYKHGKGLTLLAIALPPFDRENRVYQP